MKREIINRTQTGRNISCAGASWILPIVALLLTFFSLQEAKSEISLQSQSYVSVPQISITGRPYRMKSEVHSLVLENDSETLGWTLTAEVYQRRVEGQDFGISIPATFKFKSIKRKDGHSGRASGLRITGDNSRVEADPGFGIGTYEITYEIEFLIPPLPYADHYYGVTIFSLQV